MTITDHCYPQVALAVPGSKTALTTVASFEMRSPKRIQLRFEAGAIATPELEQSSLDIPSIIDIGGTPIDLGPLKV